MVLKSPECWKPAVEYSNREKSDRVCSPGLVAFCDLVLEFSGSAFKSGLEKVIKRGWKDSSSREFCATNGFIVLLVRLHYC